MVGLWQLALRGPGRQVGPGRYSGCVGWCGYHVFQRERAARRMLHLLADFAEFCGTGYKTTQQGRVILIFL